ncbi:MAG: hypothetical protein WAV50_03480 [Minisyncoccia bacterium]
MSIDRVTLKATNEQAKFNLEGGYSYFEGVRSLPPEAQKKLQAFVLANNPFWPDEAPADWSRTASPWGDPEEYRKSLLGTNFLRKQEWKAKWAKMGSPHFDVVFPGSPLTLEKIMGVIPPASIGMAA